MKKHFFLSLLLLPLALHAQSQAEALGIKNPDRLIHDQIQSLNLLIAATTDSLNNQQLLKKQLEDYLVIQTRYLQNTHDNDLLFQMIKAASKLLEAIKANHLTQTFDDEFISELSLFA